MVNIIDLTGKVYGKLTVVDRAENKSRAPMWNCKCSCGKTKVVNGGSLRRGYTKSCGCNQGIPQDLHPEAGQCSTKGVRFVDGKYCALDNDDNIIESFISVNDAKRARKAYLNKKVVKVNPGRTKVKSVAVSGVKLKKNGKWSAILYANGKGISCGTHETQQQAIDAKMAKAEEMGLV